MSTITHPGEAVDYYVRFWSAETPDEQRNIAADVFTDDIDYHALPAVLTGVEALMAFHAEFTEQVGPVTFRALGEPDHHHDRARLRWEIVLADGSSFAAGTDFLSLAQDNRITSVTSFLDRAPAGFEHDEQGEAAGTAS